MKVLIVNHSVQNCGVYQFGKRVAGILEKSPRNEYMYLEIDSEEKLLNKIQDAKPDAIIYNHLEGTMPWVTEETVSRIRKTGIRQTLLVHNINYATFFDAYFHQNPYFKSQDSFNFALPRPLFDYKPISRSSAKDAVMIGSFGFGFKVKHFDDLCRLVAKNFKKQKVQVNLHITESFFSPNKHVIDEIEEKCRKILKRNNQKLVVTRNFMSDEEVLNFLADQDLNIFLYEKYKNYNGISSTIDYALSAGKPIAINKSNMFSHLSDLNPSIYVEDNKLEEIISSGTKQLDAKRQLWSNDNFYQVVDKALESLK